MKQEDLQILAEWLGLKWKSPLINDWEPHLDSNQLDMLEDKMIEELDIVRIEVNKCFGGGWKAMYLNEIPYEEKIGYYSDVVAVEKGKNKNEARLNAILNYVEGVK